MSMEEMNLVLMQLSYEEFVLRKQYAETLKKLKDDDNDLLREKLNQLDNKIEHIFLTRASYYINKDQKNICK